MSRCGHVLGTSVVLTARYGHQRQRFCHEAAVLCVRRGRTVSPLNRPRRRSALHGLRSGRRPLAEYDLLKDASVFRHCDGVSPAKDCSKPRFVLAVALVLAVERNANPGGLLDDDSEGVVEHTGPGA
jgi:hypothetical protein